jgi:hypothetical protein
MNAHLSSFSGAQAKASRTPAVSGANASRTPAVSGAKASKVLRKTFHSFGRQPPCLSVADDFKNCWDYRGGLFHGELRELTDGDSFSVSLTMPLDTRIKLPKGAHPTSPQTAAITKVVQETLGGHVFPLVAFRKSPHGWLVKLTLVPTRAAAAPAEDDVTHVDYDAWWAQPPSSMQPPDERSSPSVVLSDILPAEEGWTFDEPSPGGTQRANRSLAVAGGGIPVDDFPGFKVWDSPGCTQHVIRPSFRTLESGYMGDDPFSFQ